MTKKEQVRMARLESENRMLKDAIANHMRVYGETLSELVELKAKIEVMKMVLRGDG